MSEQPEQQEGSTQRAYVSLSAIVGDKRHTMDMPIADVENLALHVRHFAESATLNGANINARVRVPDVAMLPAALRAFADGMEAQLRRKDGQHE